MAKASRARRAPTSTPPAAQAAGSESQGGPAETSAPAGGPEQEPAAAPEPSSVRTDGSGEAVDALAPAASDDTPRASQEASSFPPPEASAPGGADLSAETGLVIVAARSRDGRPYRRGGVVWTDQVAAHPLSVEQAQRVVSDPHLDVTDIG